MVRGGKIAVLRCRSSSRDRQNPLTCGPRWNRLPRATIVLLSIKTQEADMSDHWRVSADGIDSMRGTGEDAAAYAAGWTVSGLATLATIVVVWVFAI
jgi:hypothetical protein